MLIFNYKYRVSILSNMMVILEYKIRSVKMARKQFQTLSEPMYYILLALTSECCGVDIMKKVEEISKGRISVGPGTLYTLLGKFESSDLIRETEVQGRKRSYIITKQGYEALNQEYIRLKSMVNEGAEYIGGHYEDK
jgi:DNA-binding PadR family transcriptional regulator